MESIFDGELIFNTFNPKVDSEEKERVKKFLQIEDLGFSDKINFTLEIIKNNKVIATGSLEDNVLKCFAIDKAFRKKGISNKIVEILTKKAFENCITHLFIYTKPKNKKIFEKLGYHAIEQVDDLVIFLENKVNGFVNYLKNLETREIKTDDIAAIILMGSSFNKVKLYLIEQASKENDLVHLFLIEDNVDFNIKYRLSMVKKETSQLKNVIIHISRGYIVSEEKFPKYFLLDNEKIIKARAILNGKIFSKYIAKELNIKKLYTYNETLSMDKVKYNNYLKRTISNYGIDFIEVKKL